ncbi:sigma-54-dependent Fis family transcriptional regulator, partial [bacterium]|nr:sigma-54-dependent Fis family transcriptional regulator [bacterium]
LQDYSWPGNTRELKNLLERALLLQQGGEFLPSKLLGGTFVVSQDVAKAGGWQPAPLEDLEIQHIRQTLRHCDGNKTQDAYLLGISRSTLNRKLGLA